MTPPLISIITPNFNMEKFLRGCIESVLKQNYPNIEHLIIDDGSTDKSQEIIQNYANKYPGKIRYFKQKHLGHTAALNNLLKHTKGEIQLNLNSDDLLNPSACKWAYDNFIKYPNYAVIYGDEYVIDENNKIIDKFIPPDYSFQKLLCSKLVIPEQAAFIKKSYFEQVGLYYNPKIKKAMDFELWIRIGQKFKIKHVPGYVARYRWHANSGSKQFSNINKLVKEKEKIINKVLNNKLTSPSVKNSQQCAYMGLHLWEKQMYANIYNPLPQKPVISIILPILNITNNLITCLQSINNQNYSNIELIVITQVKNIKNIKKIIKNNVQLKQIIIKCQSENIIDYINAALRKISGDICVIFDQNDQMYQKACHLVVKTFLKHSNVAVIYGINDIKSKTVSNKYHDQSLDLEYFIKSILNLNFYTAFIQTKHLKVKNLSINNTVKFNNMLELLLKLGDTFPYKYLNKTVTNVNMSNYCRLGFFDYLRSASEKMLIIDKFYINSIYLSEYLKIKNTVYNYIYQQLIKQAKICNQYMASTYLIIRSHILFI
ncbi:MAG: Glycosyl transferase, family 2 [Candidatus Gottesmanbacteria bacterium GW2011_GWA1_34_13]|uniref:Glycosyl transferase, family 2 n=1 Tax=Candidatus Gottesmanbacteria bacterium GW2011_GWA1_34_13 TaxID=1618434 RepID=A0A0G0ASA6_9BACT|nr:MAG: Glycosyl transferase, family 2 [Candidatus Gottesmanbacteria bacterium GW2011_GWA1_34_13]